MDKLPEYPKLTKEFPNWFSGIHQARVAAYWEARCRLAVDALEYLAPFHSAAQVALDELGSLPAPHTDAVQK